MKSIGIVFWICLLPALAYGQEPSNPQILEPDRFDQWGDLPLNDENAELDKIALQAKEWQLSIIYLVIHAGQTACVGEAKARGIRASKYLALRRLSSDRIVTIDAGWRKEVSVQVWIWPPELGKPTVLREFNLKPSAVKLEKNCRIRHRPRVNS